MAQEMAQELRGKKQAQTGVLRGGLQQTKGAQIRSAQRRLARREGLMSSDSARTRSLSKSLPRGLTIGEFTDGRARAFFVRYRGSEGRRLESFASEVERNDRAVVLRREFEERTQREAEAEVLERFDKREWEEFKEWKREREARRAGVTVEEAIAAYLEAREGDGLTRDSLLHMRVNLVRFSQLFGGLDVREVDAEHVRAWLANLSEERGFSAVTVSHHRKALSAFYNYAVRARWVSENPCERVASPRIVRRDDVGVLSLRDAFEFFRANRDERAIGRLAAEAFGGLRYSSAARLAFADLDFENAGITMPAAKHKMGRRFYVDGWPRNLWRWLAHAPRMGWEQVQRGYAEDKKWAFARARVTNTGNVLRHTFATMHLAAFRDGAATAVLLTHRDINMLLTHYRGRGVSRAAARAYFCITPKTVMLGWERFCRAFGVPVSEQGNVINNNTTGE